MVDAGKRQPVLDLLRSALCSSALVMAVAGKSTFTAPRPGHRGDDAAGRYVARTRCADICLPALWRADDRHRDPAAQPSWPRATPSPGRTAMNPIACRHSTCRFNRRQSAPMRERSAPRITSVYSGMKRYRMALRISACATPFCRVAARLLLLIDIATHGGASQIAIASSQG